MVYFWKSLWSTDITAERGTDTAAAETPSHTAVAAGVEAEVEAGAETAAAENIGAGAAAGVETGTGTTAEGMGTAPTAQSINTHCRTQQSNTLTHITVIMKSSSRSQADGPCEYMPRKLWTVHGQLAYNWSCCAPTSTVCWACMHTMFTSPQQFAAMQLAACLGPCHRLRSCHDRPC